MNKKNVWMGAAAAACVIGSGSLVMTVMAAPRPGVEADVGNGAPTRVLLDNDTLRVTLVSFPKGFKREGGLRRRMEQLIVYVDDGEFKVIPQPGAERAPRSTGRGPESPITLEGEVSRGLHPKGTIAWHPKDSLTPTLVTSRAYRALYIEMKKSPEEMRK